MSGTLIALGVMATLLGGGWFATRMVESKENMDAIEAGINPYDDRGSNGLGLGMDLSQMLPMLSMILMLGVSGFGKSSNGGDDDDIEITINLEDDD
jgi:hypothetical protein